MSKLLGDVSAYAYAVSQGYTGTEEQFAADMARIGTTASEAAASADAAAESASDAATEANTARTQAEAAAASANAASGSVTLAAQQAGIAQASASEASQYMRNAESYAGAAQEAADEAETTIETVRGYASNAEASKVAAATSATNAAASATAAQTAQTAAETAQGKAETAASSVSASAAQIAKNTANFASEFSASTTYAIGDYCIHEGTLYRFTNEHTGAWSASDVEATNVGGEIGDVKSAITSLYVTQYITPVWHQGYIKTSSGETGADNNYCYCDYIESNGKQYVITGANGYKVKVAKYNSQKVFQSIVVSTTSDFPVTFKLNSGEFFRIQFGLGDSATTPASITSSVFTLAYAGLTDKSLSKSGKAADAKSAGDAIEAIKTDIYSVKTYGSDLWESGSIVSYENAANAARLRTIGYIPAGCLEIRCDSEYACLVIAYNASGVGVGRMNTDGEISASGTAAWLSIIDLRSFADEGYQYRLVLKRADELSMTVSDDAGKCHLVYLVNTNQSEEASASVGTTKKSNAALVEQIKGVADSYYAHKDDTSGGQPVMTYGQSTIFDSAQVTTQIDCSTFVGLCLRGIEFGDTPYNPEWTGGAKDPTYWLANTDDYVWAVNPFDYVQDDGVYNGSCRTAAQIAKWMIAQGQQVILDAKLCNLEPGDILFYARKNSETGEWIQPNRFMHINHIAMCYSKERMAADAQNWDASKYPYKHGLVEVTTVTGAVNKTVVEADWDDPTNIYDNNINTLVLVCRPDLGALVPALT